MNEEELKAGERYNFTLLYTGQSINNKFRFESPTGIHYILGLGDMEAVSPVSAPENGMKNTDPTPKYDPCRKFREGDKVRAVEYKGRRGTDCPNFTGKIYTVSQEERSNGLLKLTDDVYVYYIDPAYVELVTPIEELERYVVKPGDIAWFVVDKEHESGELNVVMYATTHPNPKAAAEAECSRLNAEHRKDQQ